MYNTMVKLRNKKAFTLVEMMAVIAIVAVLVAVVVPIIGNSTTKARAATNAANLRSVESELATMKVSNPDYFIAATDSATTTVDKAALGVYKYLYNLWYGEDEASIQLDGIVADDAGTLSFFINNLTKEGTAITLSGVPTSVAVSADTGMDVAEGTKMVVFLSGNTFVAAYAGTDGVYFDKDCFAEVAETGKFTGEGTSSSGGLQEAWNDFLCTMGNHDWSKKDGECARCGKTCVHRKWTEGVCNTCGFTCSNHVWEKDASGHSCETCGLSATHTWTNTDVAEKLKEYGITVATDGTCSVCEYQCTHTGRKTSNIYAASAVYNGYEIVTCDDCGKILSQGTHSHIDNNNDHICDTCSNTASDCADDDKDCKCDVCGKEKHDGTGHLCYCGKTPLHSAHEASVSDILGALAKEEQVGCKYCTATASLTSCGYEGYVSSTYGETDGKCNKCGNKKNEHTTKKVGWMTTYYYYEWSTAVPTPKS